MMHIRGNAIPETALTVSFTLLVLYGIVQLATTAFYQVSADGASFVASHDTVATIGNPSVNNQSIAATSASGAFSKIVAKSVSVINPNAQTFETDVNQQVPGISALGNPQALTITSRQIEAMAGSASPSPLMNCTQGTLNIVNGLNTKVLNSKAVGLLQGNQLISDSPLSVGGTNVLQLATGPLTGRVNLLGSVNTDLNATVNTLKGLPATITAIPVVGAILLPTLSSALEGPVNDALSGTFSSASELATIDSQLNVVPGVTSLLINSVINPILTGGSAGTGLLGSSGPLTALTADIKGLQTIDAGAATCPTS